MKSVPQARTAMIGAILAVIVAVAAALRGFELGRLSFWYDEVVTMHVAQARSPAALIDRLVQIDATRAPLHPLLLAAWTGAFGTSEATARAFSALFGTATVVMIYLVGRTACGAATGLWAAWLGTISPPLIFYAREARMYALLAFVTCFCWWWLLRLTASFTTARAIAYASSLVALVYTHPLGLLMLGTLALASLVGPGTCLRSWKRWLVVHVIVTAFFLPWIGKYLDHSPEFLTGPLPIRFLVGTPIGFIGGDSRVLLGLAALVALGLAGHVLARDSINESRIGIPRWVAPVFLLLWLILPPAALYVYSRVAQPVFGPERYMLFVAPAYLILVALGMGRLPVAIRYPVALGLTILAWLSFGSKVYDPELKADWRGFSSSLIAQPAKDKLVIVASSNPARNVEVETARYYLPAGCTAIALEEAKPDRIDQVGAGTVYLAVGSRRGIPVARVPDQIGPYRFAREVHFPGLTVWRAEH
jgi:uncharacterized membrane protein